MIHISDTDECIHIRADEEEVTIDNEPCEDADVTGKLTSEVLKQIIAGEQTFQKAFMSGEMSAKGNFKTLRMLDQMFGF